MSVKFFRVAAITGAALVAVGALASCNDSTTTSAPIGTDAVTTTSMEASNSSLASTSSSESETSTDADEGASRASESAPDTKPNSSTKVPKNFPGITTPSGAKLTDSEEAYLADLKRQKVEFMGDTDNNVALTMGKYVCAQREQKTDSTMIKAFVTAAIGPMTDNEAQAKGRADKVIRAADRNLC